MQFRLNVVRSAVPAAMHQCKNLVERGTEFASSNLPDGPVKDLARALASNAKFIARLREHTATLTIPAEHPPYQLAISGARNMAIEQLG